MKKINSRKGQVSEGFQGFPVHLRKLFSAIVIYLKPIKTKWKNKQSMKSKSTALPTP